MTRTSLFGLVCALGCASTSAPSIPDAGAGGSGYLPGGTVASATAGGVDRASSSSGIPDASDPCASCRGAANSPHVVGPFCAASDAFAAWAAYVSCGCAPGGSCSTDCAAGSWCAGVYPGFTSWTDPAGPCANCLAAHGSTGCGDELSTCEKN